MAIRPRRLVVALSCAFAAIQFAGVQAAAATPPGAPSNVTATIGNQQATVSWTAPTSDGGSPILGYSVTPFAGAAAGTPVTFNSTATTETVTGLTNCTGYTFTVAAFNAIGTGPASTSSPSVTVGAPVLRAVTVNQGVGSNPTASTGFNPLVRGKDTLVRFYLSLPSCASSSTQIRLTGGTLTVGILNGTILGTVSAPTPPPIAPFPQIATFSVAPLVDSPGDPKFLVPGSVLAPASTTAAFTATFSGTISYQWLTGKSATAVPGAVTLSTIPGTSSPITASVEHKTNALRILVVPMGDTSQLSSSEFSSKAQSAVQDGLLTMSRVYPVENGTGDLIGTAGGLRYTINSGLLNLGPSGLNLMPVVSSSTTTSSITGGAAITSLVVSKLGTAIPGSSLITISSGGSSQALTVTSAGAAAGATSIPIANSPIANATYPNGSSVTFSAFCGTSANFDTVKGQLATFLQAWNTANPSATADRVLGVIDQSISLGSSSACAEGMAAVNSTQAWARSNYTVSPSITGGVMAMEIAHTMGVVPASRYDIYSPYHSPNVAADGTSPNRAYNITQRSYLANNRTAMDFADGFYNNVNAVLEPADYGFILCVLGGTQNTECGTATGTVGTSTGVGANPTFVMSGTTDGTTAGTTVVESYFAAGVARSTPDSTSVYRLLMRQSGTVLQDFGVPVTFIQDLHNGAPSPVTPPMPTNTMVGLFSIAFPFNTATTRIEFWNGEPGTGATLLYARDNNGPLPAPTLSTRPLPIASVPIDYTKNPPALNSQPAVSPNRQWVAWVPVGVSPIVVNVAPIGNASQAVRLTANGSPIPSFNPAWSQDGSALAYVDGFGGLDTVTVDTSSGTPKFGSPTPVPLSGITSPVRNPTWSPDGSEIAFESGRNIFKVNRMTGSVTQLTTAGHESFPSWSRTPGDNRIAFVDVPPCGGGVLISEFPIPSVAGSGSITSGPDGNLWFQENLSNKIGRITVAGTFTEFAIPTANSGVAWIAAGPDGNLWFTEGLAGKIGRISTSGVVTEFALPTGGDPARIAAGPDGNLWFTEFNTNRVARITTTGVITEYPVPTAGSLPDGIAAGPAGDGNVWFTEVNGNKIGRITPTGTFAEFPIPTLTSKPEGIVAGPDGNLWFTESFGNKIGRITTSGTITEVPVPTANSGPIWVTVGPDQNVWFAESNANRLARVSLPSGVITEFTPVPTAGSAPFGITAGQDGNVWFTELFGNKIGRLTPPTGTAEFGIPTAVSRPARITTGGDGNLWFTENLGNTVARISPTTGTFTEFVVPTIESSPYAIAAGPDGNLWFTEFAGNKVARITTAGVITEISIPTLSTSSTQPAGITAGPPSDGNLWFVESNGNKVGRINTTTLALTEFPIPTASSSPNGIVAGPDGNLWFTENSGNKIGRINPSSGAITEFPVPTASSKPNEITVGPDGNLWFTEFSGNQVARISPAAGAVTEFGVPTTNSQPSGITKGRDGNLWFTEFANNKVARMTTAGTVTEFVTPTVNSQPLGITTGPDANLWLAEVSGNRIARLVPPTCSPVPNILTLNPVTGTTSSTLLVSGGSEPSWGDTSLIAFVRAGAIWAVKPDGTASQQLTTGTDNAPSIAGGTVAFERNLAGSCGGECVAQDIFLLNLVQQVTVTAFVNLSSTPSPPANLRVDLFYTCGGTAFPVAVGLAPQSSNANSSTFSVTFDPSLACPGGSLSAVANDGFQLSPPSSPQPMDSISKPPVPTLDNPIPGTHFLQFDNLPLRGTARDPKDGELSGSALQWASTIPGTAQPGTGTTIDLTPPPGGWTPGTYNVILTATDSAGNTATTSSTFTIDADADNDGLSAAVEAQPCFAPNGGSDDPNGPDPQDAFRDYVGDGIPNIDKIALQTPGGPCVPNTSYRSTGLMFAPQKLFIPSNGKTVTVSDITVRYRDLNQIDGSTVRIVSIEGKNVSSNPLFTNPNNIGWAVLSDGTATVSFSRQNLIQYLSGLGSATFSIMNRTITITITGQAPSAPIPWSFQGVTSTFVAPGS